MTAMYKKIFFKVVYIIIIFVISLGLYNFLASQNASKGAKQPDFDNAYLINKQSTDPKRLFF